MATDDADATAARITEAGGTIVVEPMDVGPMGGMVIALDPQGNPFGLWQAGEHTGVTIHNEPGALAWNDAAVDDPDAAQAFYSAVFDYRFDPMEGMDDLLLGGSTDSAVAAAQKAGATITMAPLDTEFGRFAVLEDPWGAAFSVMQDPPA